MSDRQQVSDEATAERSSFRRRSPVAVPRGVVVSPSAGPVVTRGAQGRRLGMKSSFVMEFVRRVGALPPGVRGRSRFSERVAPGFPVDGRVERRDRSGRAPGAVARGIDPEHLLDSRRPRSRPFEQRMRSAFIWTERRVATANRPTAAQVRLSVLLLGRSICRCATPAVGPLDVSNASGAPPRAPRWRSLRRASGRGAALFRRRSREVQEGLRAAWRELLDPAKAG